MAFKSGFISIIGRPNVGKSSLLNQLLGEKVSIVTNKAQTTRHNIKGILTVPQKYQLIFVDTPGIHTAHKSLNRQMNAAAFKGLRETDLTIFMVPANEKIGKNDLYLLADLQKKNHPFALIISKKDLVTEPELNLKIQEWQQKLEKENLILPISIQEPESLVNLVKKLLALLPPNDYQYFENNVLTDQSMKQRIQDLIREAILFKTGQEVPHNTLVLVESLKNRHQILEVHAAIIVERNSQKAILIGHQGKKIKDIKYRVRKNLKQLYPNHEIELNLLVKVKSNWRNSASLVKKEITDKNNFD